MTNCLKYLKKYNEILSNFQKKIFFVQKKVLPLSFEKNNKIRIKNGAIISTFTCLVAI